MNTRHDLCRHCLKESRSIVGRGLCIGCWRQPAVRNLYPCRATGRAARLRPELPDQPDQEAPPEPRPEDLSERDRLRLTWFGGLAA